MSTETLKPPALNWAIPSELKVPADKLQLRLDYHQQAVVITYFEGDTAESRIVSAMDVAAALASELTFTSGLLPPQALWWGNTKQGPVTTIYTPPKVRRVALSDDPGKPPRRFDIPFPGLVFICQPARPPWVYAVKKCPTKETDIVYNAPLLNVFENGKSCPGNHDYPDRAADIPDSFFASFFTMEGYRRNRSRMFPNNVFDLWVYLDKKKKFPANDLLKLCTVKDLMMLGMTE